MTQLSISMPPALQTWVDARLSEGSYADAADYLRDLVRRDQADAAGDRQWLKAMIDEGFASGAIDRDPRDVIDELLDEDPDLRA
ncbi:ribbon-helix-helix domain-containing protein [Sphingomonas sp. PB4P5]|uniref:ribbon-helix-helix domain-containing protein n=1 Tax=Parasphingomonas puruogangriensis TaxID=3096155 RepID=UPI002FC5F1D6